MRVCRMRTGIIVDVNSADRARLEGIVAARNSPQKHVWRARIVLLTATASAPTRSCGALAGAVHARRRRRVVARQDAPVAGCAAAAGGCRARRRADPDRSAG